MKKEYSRPELEIIELNEDIMDTVYEESITDEWDGVETPGFGTGI